MSPISVTDIRVGGVPVYVTLHAMQRMADREVQLDELVRVLEAEPTKVRAVVAMGLPRQFPLRFSDLTLVVRCAGKSLHVVTIYRRRKR